MCYDNHHQKLMGGLGGDDEAQGKIASMKLWAELENQLQLVEKDGSVLPVVETAAPLGQGAVVKDLFCVPGTEPEPEGQGNIKATGYGGDEAFNVKVEVKKESHPKFKMEIEKESRDPKVKVEVKKETPAGEGGAPSGDGASTNKPTASSNRHAKILPGALPVVNDVLKVIAWLAPMVRDSYLDEEACDPTVERDENEKQKELKQAAMEVCAENGTALLGATNDENKKSSSAAIPKATPGRGNKKMKRASCGTSSSSTAVVQIAGDVGREGELQEQKIKHTFQPAPPPTVPNSDRMTRPEIEHFLVKLLGKMRLNVDALIDVYFAIVDDGTGFVTDVEKDCGAMIGEGDMARRLRYDRPRSSTEKIIKGGIFKNDEDQEVEEESSPRLVTVKRTTENQKTVILPEGAHKEKSRRFFLDVLHKVGPKGYESRTGANGGVENSYNASNIETRSNKFDEILFLELPCGIMEKYENRARKDTKTIWFSW
eukprot:g19551.t1